MILAGISALLYSVLFSSLAATFIGLGLIFWGTLFLYIKPERYVQASVLNAITNSSSKTLKQITTNLEYGENLVFLPPKYSKALDTDTMFLSSEEELITSLREELRADQIFVEKPKGIVLNPIGLDLANLCEKKLGKGFSETNFDHIQKNLQKTLIDNLELARNLELNLEGSTIKLTLTGSIYHDLIKTYGPAYCPLCSCVGIAICRAKQRPILLEKTYSEKESIVEVYYRAI